MLLMTFVKMKEQKKKKKIKCNTNFGYVLQVGLNFAV